MTTLETNPIAFFFRPLSSTPCGVGDCVSGVGTAALSNDPSPLPATLVPGGYMQRR